MDSLISVTSSGRSSIRSISRCISGLFLVIDLATSLRRVVLPALGGDTIIPLCPLPTGHIISIIRIAMLPPGVSSLSFSSGKIGVRSSKFLRLQASEGARPFIVLTNRSAPNLSLGFLTLILPTTISPVLRPNLLI